jgi:hypothetical protein
MEPAASTPARDKPARQTLIGTAVAAWAALDPVVGIIIVLLAEWVGPLILFAASAVVLTIVNMAACSWLDRSWASFASGPGKRLEKRLEKMRTGRVMKHPVAWIQTGSDRWFALAAVLTNAVSAVGIARIVGGKPVGQRRIRFASTSFSIFAAALFTLLGWLIAEGIQAL